MRKALLLVLALFALAAPAADTPHSFTDPALKGRYEQLLQELRCLVCQNQSLADSHADLAQDLRDEVFRMLNEGADDAAIRAFMVARYGEFVLYRPPVSALTVGLWFSPVLVLAGVAAFWWRRQRAGDRGGEQPLSDEERARLAALLSPPPARTSSKPE